MLTEVRSVRPGFLRDVGMAVAERNLAPRHSSVLGALSGLRRAISYEEPLMSTWVRTL